MSFYVSLETIDINWRAFPRQKLFVLPLKKKKKRGYKYIQLNTAFIGREPSYYPFSFSSSSSLDIIMQHVHVLIASFLFHSPDVHLSPVPAVKKKKKENTKIKKANVQLFASTSVLKFPHMFSSCKRLARRPPKTEELFFFFFKTG